MSAVYLAKKNRPCSYFIQSTIRNEAKWVRNSKIQIDNKILKTVSSLESLPQKALGVKKNSNYSYFVLTFSKLNEPTLHNPNRNGINIF